MHELGQVFRHAFGEGGDQGAEARFSRFAAFVNAVLHLIFNGFNLNRRVDQASGANDLFGKYTAGLFHFPSAGCRRNAHGLRAHNVPFVKAQRPVVDARRQAKPIFGQRQLSPVVTLGHRADLRHRLVTFIDKQQRIIRQIFKQGRWWLTRQAASQKP